MACGVPGSGPGAAAVAKTSVSPSRLQIDGIGDLWTLAQLLFKGGGASIQNVDRPEKVFTIILHGLEVGLAPTQALANIMMQPNGRCSIWGDGALALVRASGLLAKHVPETVTGDGDDRTATCIVQRKDEPEARFTFSMREAKAAGLISRSLGKDGKGTGPWITYPDRMLKMRARGFALRDVFPDVLKGLVTAEEAQDTLDVETGAPRVVQVQATVDGPSVVESNGTAPGVPVGGDGGPKALPPADSTTPPPDGPPTPDQMARLAWIKRQLAVSKSLTEKADIDAAWKELLGGYASDGTARKGDAPGVASVKEFTHAAAAKFLAAEEPKHDPFIHPPESSRAA
jgi:hypothetical protein